jgi:hypothetical protein
MDENAGKAVGTRAGGRTLVVVVRGESASLCVIDAAGRIVREAKAASEPEVLAHAVRHPDRAGGRAAPRIWFSRVTR